MAFPKLVITDIDGVWTDGGMYYDNTNVELKKFHTYDSAGVLFCRLLNVPVAIITGENTPIVQRRADKLKIEHLYLGVKDKVKVASELKEKYQLSWDEIAYIGDDINDIQLLKKVGVSAVVNSAPDYIKQYSKITLSKNGGEGAFREFVEYLLKENNLLNKVLDKYFEQQSYEQ